MNRIQVNITLKQAADVIARDLRSKQGEAHERVRRHPELKQFTTQIDALETKKRRVRNRLEKQLVEPIRKQLAAHEAEVKAAREQMNWAITADEKLAARKRVLKIIERAKAVAK